VISPEAAHRLFLLQQRSNIFEAIIARLYGALLAPGDLAVDGGAHRGMHSWSMARAVTASGEVLAAEPVPALAEGLRKTARLLGLPQIRVEEAALAEAEGLAAFHWVTNAEGYSGLRPRPYPLEAETRMLEVRQARLDQLLEGTRRPWRFAKLDLEGGEFRALQGAGRALARHRPVLVFENAREGAARAYGYDAAAWFGLFRDLDYQLFDLFGRDLGPEDWWRDDLPWYFIGVPAGSPDEEFLRGPFLGLLHHLLDAA
jgi:FkbM family methyltransferase